VGRIRGYSGRARAVLPWRPEWPAGVLIALAWVALLAAPGGHHEGEHGHPGAVAADRPAALVCDLTDLRRRQSAWVSRPAEATTGPHAGLPHWTLMAMAMMAPVALPAVRHVGLNSMRRRRQRSMGVYLGVYVAVWAGFGAVALAAVHLARETLGLDERVLLALALATAGAWQVTRAKRRAVLACGRTVPLPPVGLRADAGCARFALKSAWRCVKSCWALMLVMAVMGPASIFWMAGLTALVLVEERTRIGRRLLRPSGAVLALAAALVLLA
jgi:predicted metal-binding membrane protein